MSRVALLLCAALLAPGCSFGMKRVPDDWNPAEELECTSGLGGPLFDLLAGGAAAGGSWLFYDKAVSCGTDCGAEAYYAGTVVLAVSAVPMLLASGYGLYQARACRSSQQDRERLLEIERGEP